MSKDDKTPEGGIAADDEVKISSKKLSAILQRLDTLEKGLGGQDSTLILEEADKHTGIIRLYEEKPIVRYGKNHHTQLPGGKEKIDIEIFVLNLKDEEEPFTVDYAWLLNEADKVTVQIVEEKKKKIVEDFGKVEVTKVKDYRTEGTGVFVPMVAVRYEYQYIVKLPDQRQILTNLVS